MDPGVQEFFLYVAADRKAIASRDVNRRLLTGQPGRCTTDPQALVTADGTMIKAP